MTQLQRWLLAGTVLQALQIGSAGAVSLGMPDRPAAIRDGVMLAQVSEEEIRRRRQQQQPQAAPQQEQRRPERPQAAPPQQEQRRPERPQAPPQQEMRRPERPQPQPQQEMRRPERPQPQPQPEIRRLERPQPQPQPEMRRPEPQPQRQPEIRRPERPQQVMPPQQQEQRRPERPQQVVPPRPPVETAPSQPIRPPAAAPEQPQRPQVERPAITPTPDQPRRPMPDAPQRPGIAPQGAAPQPGTDVRPRPPQPGEQPDAPRRPGAGPQDGPPVVAPDGRPRPGVPGVQPGPQPGFAPQQGQPPQGGPGPQGRAPRGVDGQPLQRPAVVPLNPTPPAQQRDARRNDRNDRRNGAAVGAAAGFVGGFLAGAAVGRIDDVRQQRQVVEQNGVRYYQEPGRTIIRDGNNVYIRHDETERFRDLGIRMREERRDGMRYSSYVGAGGVTIITVMSPDGQLLKRYRRFPNGREVIIIDNTFRGPGRGFDPDVVYIAPPPIMIPRERYIVEADEVDEGVIEEVFRAPPVARVERRYTLDEVRQSQGLRAYMPSVDVDTITFATGSWEVTYEQANKLAGIAEAIKRTLQANPSEVYLVEGYTDAVGDEEDNLSLSDRRAQSVAAILTRSFGIPAENLTTQGYGEQYPKVETDGPEQANRRVTMRRITPLLTGQAQQ